MGSTKVFLMKSDVPLETERLCNQSTGVSCETLSQESKCECFSSEQSFSHKIISLSFSYNYLLDQQLP